ncbi:MAG: enoyl-CoA hydratase/isomerase family protein [Burkholderiaceae bacterium]|nr:enoyl-CoA hydratase/isomerase family protein [Burkholderiaceae bacterium]
MSDDAVLFDVQEGVATLTLNDPARMNPLSPPIREGFLAALARVQGDTAIRVLVIKAAGKGFCVGADLSEIIATAEAPGGASAQEQITDLMDNTATPLVTQLRALRVPVVCAIDGAVAGGGVGLALAADIVVATRASYFYLPFVTALGMVPDMGASWFMPRTIGTARSVGMTLLGKRVPAQQAADWGLIWACVDDASALADEVATVAARLARLPARAIQEVRAMFDAAQSNTLSAQLLDERDRQVRLAGGPDFAEGLRAFKEKRRPDFE